MHRKHDNVGTAAWLPVPLMFQLLAKLLCIFHNYRVLDLLHHLYRHYATGTTQYVLK